MYKRQDLQSAPVEALHHHAVDHAGLADRAQQHTHKVLGRQRGFGGVRVDLGFDVEAHLVGSQILHQLEQRSQRGDALPVAWLLVRKVAGVAAGRVDASDVIALDLGQTQRADQRPTLGQPLAFGIARDGGVQCWIVRDHGHAIGGDGDVQFQRRDAQAQCADCLLYTSRCV